MGSAVYDHLEIIQSTHFMGGCDAKPEEGSSFFSHIITGNRKCVNCFLQNIAYDPGAGEYKESWFLIAAYTFHFVALLEVSNFKWIDRLYRREEDKIIARRGIPVTVLYTALLFFGMGMIIVLFHLKNLENNTLPAIKLTGLLLVGILAATIGCLWEGRRIKMWPPADAEYKFGWGSMVCFLLCVVAYGLMCLV